MSREISPKLQLMLDAQSVWQELIHARIGRLEDEAVAASAIFESNGQDSRLSRTLTSIEGTHDWVYGMGITYPDQSSAFLIQHKVTKDASYMTVRADGSIQTMATALRYSDCSNRLKELRADGEYATGETVAALDQYVELGKIISDLESNDDSTTQFILGDRHVKLMTETNPSSLIPEKWPPTKADLRRSQKRQKAIEKAVFALAKNMFINESGNATVGCGPSWRTVGNTEPPTILVTEPRVETSRREASLQIAHLVHKGLETLPPPMGSVGYLSRQDDALVEKLYASELASTIAKSGDLTPLQDVRSRIDYARRSAHIDNVIE